MTPSTPVLEEMLHHWKYRATCKGKPLEAQDAPKVEIEINLYLADIGYVAAMAAYGPCDAAPL